MRTDTAPGLEELWEHCRKEYFYPHRKAYVETPGEQD